MWVKGNGGLVHTTDSNRVFFRTSISRSLLDKLELTAKDNNTHINYILENGLENFLSSSIDEDDIAQIKETRWNSLKDRQQYGSLYDETILESMRSFAKAHKLFLNDIVEYSVNYVQITNVKGKDHRNRVEN